jgi:hypothetical protein
MATAASRNPRAPPAFERFTFPVAAARPDTKNLGAATTSTANSAAFWSGGDCQHDDEDEKGQKENRDWGAISRFCEEVEE